MKAGEFDGISKELLSAGRVEPAQRVRAHLSEVAGEQMW
jgi:hypothetical protein